MPLTPLQIDEQIKAAVKIVAPTNALLPFLIVSQARLESGNYSSALFKNGNNCFGHKFSAIFIKFGATKGNISPEKDYYAYYPEVTNCINAHLFLYRESGRYAGIKDSTNSKQFTDILAKGGYAPGHEKEYETQISYLTKLQLNGTALKATVDGGTKEIKNYFIRYSNDTSIRSLNDFIKYWKLDIKDTDLINFKDNINTLFAHYKKNQKEKYKKGVVDLIEYGTPIKIPNTANVVKSVYQIHQTIEKNIPFTAFIEAEIKRLLYDPKYKKLNLPHKNISDGGTYKKFEKATVLLWSKCLSPNEDKVLDISEFIISINTANSTNGGNFTIKLPKITYISRTNSNGEIDHILDGKMNSNGEFVQKQLTHIISDVNQKKYAKNSYQIDDNDFLKESDGKYHTRTNSFFIDTVQANDIIFIMFEELELDEKNSRKKLEKFYTEENGFKWVDSSFLSNNIFDCIALVDNSSRTSNESLTNEEVTIAGRDFSKVLLDDGVQFFLVTYGLKSLGELVLNGNSLARERYTISNSQNNALSNFQKNITLISNTAIQDEGFNFFIPHSISEYLTYIFTKLTHVTILKGKLFNSYKNKSFIVSSQVQKGENDDFNINYKTVEASGIWKIIKLVIDPKIADRKILDLSFINDSGSLMNFVKKVCQKPFVEFFTDTYGDKFYFIVRKPPFTLDSYAKNFTINIYDDDVENDQITMCNEVYSYYQLNPLGSVIKNPTLLMQFLPAVILPEYLEIFGNKILKIDTNYLDFDITDNKDSKKDVDKIIQQHRNDMDYLIETTAYLPFTRVGRIVLKEDRRIKKGTNIRYMPTGELFYVESCSNSIAFSDKGVERATVLEVSHGIVEKHYDKYFSIVNLFRTYGETNKNTWKVNLNIFDFFIKNKQFK